MARDQYATHLVDEHASEIDADIPEGMVQVRVGDEGDWKTMTFEDALEYHETVHDVGDR